MLQLAGIRVHRRPAAGRASVLIKIRPGASLPDSAIPAITNLVASAVEGLARSMFRCSICAGIC